MNNTVKLLFVNADVDFVYKDGIVVLNGNSRYTFSTCTRVRYTHTTMHIAYYHSPIGWLELNASADAVFAIDFIRRPTRSRHTTTPLLVRCIQQLDEYFQNNRKKFTLTFAVHGTPFQEAVWQALTRIPYGTVQSYGEVARAIDKPTAARAVGQAIHCNPIAIIIPCHRVVGSNNALTGYAGGIERKQWLLKHEHVAIEH